MTIVIWPHMTTRQSAVVGMETSEFADIFLFRQRVEQFARSLTKSTSPPIAKKTIDRNTGEVIEFEANTPEVDEVLVLATRFRLIYAQKEPTHFKRILNFVGRRVNDDWAQGYLAKLRSLYHDAENDAHVTRDLGHATSNKDIIDLWFNSEFFHSEHQKREALANIHNAIGEAPSLFQLYTAIRRCAVHIQALYTVVHMLDVSHPFIYTPNHHFGRQKEVNLA